MISMKENTTLEVKDGFNIEIFPDLRTDLENVTITQTGPGDILILGNVRESTISTEGDLWITGESSSNALQVKGKTTIGQQFGLQEKREEGEKSRSSHRERSCFFGHR